MKQEWFEEADSVLLQLIASVRQTSHKKASRIASALIAKVSGVAGASGVLGLIGLFGTASTGTAIVGLSGAAKSTATLYWLGSLVSGGVVVGTVLTGGIGLVSGYFGLKWWKGKPRNPEDLTEEENAIVNASISLIKAFREQLELNASIAEKDANFLREEAWDPLVSVVREYKEERATKTLNIKNYLVLGSCVSEMDRLSSEL